MNKFFKLILSIMGAASVAMNIFIPIAIATLWINVTKQSGYVAALLAILGGLASLFRAVKIMIGWNKHE